MLLGRRGRGVNPRHEKTDGAINHLLDGLADTQVRLGVELTEANVSKGGNLERFAQVRGEVSDGSPNPKSDLGRHGQDRIRDVALPDDRRKRVVAVPFVQATFYNPARFHLDPVTEACLLETAAPITTDRDRGRSRDMRDPPAPQSNQSIDGLLSRRGIVDSDAAESKPIYLPIEKTSGVFMSQT